MSDDDIVNFEVGQTWSYWDEMLKTGLITQEQYDEITKPVGTVTVTAVDRDAGTLTIASEDDPKNP